VSDKVREQLYSKSTEDTTRATALSDVSRLYVLIRNLLWFVIPIPGVTRSHGVVEEDEEEADGGALPPPAIAAAWCGRRMTTRRRR